MTERINPYKSPAAAATPAADRKLFWACWVALITTAFAFIIRALIMPDLADQFGLDKTQTGQIFGAGLWPFAISIVLFSLIIDKIGYGRSMVFAFICHIAFVIITVSALLFLAPPGSSDSGCKRTAYGLLAAVYR